MATSKQTPALTKAKNAPQTAAPPPAVTTPHGTAVALPAGLMERLGKQAKDVAAKERPSLSKISLKNGIISYSGNPVAGNVLPVVVLYAAHRNTYYTGSYDPDNLQNPTCFAVSLEGEDMHAHENVPDSALPGKVRECAKCPLHQWGSDPRPSSRGKACKETRRLIVMPASAIESVEDVQKAELAVIDLPVTSGKNYSGYVNTVSTAHNVPPWVCITEISTKPDPRTQFKVNFELTGFLPSEEIVAAVEARIEEARRIAMVPYDEVASTETTKMVPAAATKKAKF